MANSLCSRCFHSYVCEQFNEHRDSTAEYTCCHFYNDHFVDAADVKPVKHGRWVEMVEREHDDYTGEYWDEVYYNCLECDYASDWKSPYCPNCGADMREDST